MDQAIRDLTERIYQEGVQKGEAQAREAVAQAQERAGQIIAEARAEAERIRAEAVRASEEIRTQVEAQIRMAGRQAMDTVRQQLTTMITAQAVDPAVGRALSDPGVVADLLRAALTAWNPAQHGSPALEVLLPADRRSELEQALKTEVGRILNAGVTVRFTGEIGAGFEIARQDGSYRVRMTDDAFAALFSQFLRPRVRALLFGEQS